ncbi:glycoside hydrolase family 47 protein, partial [Aureobasidium melanogenum]
DSPDAFLQTWKDAHSAIMRHVYRDAYFTHPHYAQNDLYTGGPRLTWIDSLSAYYPGLLVLAGELDEAITAHLLYTALWSRYGALPERWDATTGAIHGGLRWWGGRPEFIESTWYLYQATKDPWYLHIGEMALRDIKRRCYTRCGWAGLQDVRTGEQTDRMESFFLGETAKYMYLLFDPDHPLNTIDAPWVFTTEGHPLIIPKANRTSTKQHHNRKETQMTTVLKVQAEQCPIPPALLPLTVSSTAARSDVFHAASLARLHLMPIGNKPGAPSLDWASDHPSVTMLGPESPTNFTFYPWTLPLNLIPSNGYSTKLSNKPTFDLTFPTTAGTGLEI